MPKKKRPGGPHKTPRTPVQIPNEWLSVARKLAAKKEQPTVWLILSLIDKHAREAGMEGLPLLPWEDDET